MSTPGSASRLRTERSDALGRRAASIVPGGVNSPVRAMRAIGREPIFVAAGEGAELVDVDGNRYLDYVCSWGPLILGHGDQAVREAVHAAVERGTSYGAPTAGEVELAEDVAARFRSVQMLRMVTSGTEAAMSAVRLARAATGRDRVLKFAGAYHGHSDGLLVQAGSGVATQGIPASPGVTASQAAETLVVPWNDREAVAAAIGTSPPAALLVEPIPANMGVVPPDKGFLEFLREQADASGALLIFDEVITGFRVARGGAQELYGVEADLTLLGKVLGGGLPAAAYGGRRNLMELVAPAGPVYQAGTLAGSPLAIAAGRATLGKLDARAYGQLAALTGRLAAGLRDAAGDRPVQVISVCGLLTVFFSAVPVRDFEAATSCDTEAYARFCRSLLERGVYPPPSQFEAWFVSLAHDEAAIDRTVEAAAEAFGEALG